MKKDAEITFQKYNATEIDLQVFSKKAVLLSGSK